MLMPAPVPPSLSDPQLVANLILHKLPGLGCAGYWRLLDRFDHPVNVLQQPCAALQDHLNDEALAAVTDYQRRTTTSRLGQAALRDLDWLNHHQDVLLLYPQHPAYPDLLREITRPPVLLYLKGDINCLALPQLAIIGSRTPTPGGRDNAISFARDLAAGGFAITSGLALGIDGAAHTGALAAHGKTLAVFGTGIDSVYPRRHQSLAEDILAKGGALVSEYPPGTRSQAANFPRRNRLISGLSLGTLVVEAALQSGSLITARLAMEQNREVFAIPGSIHNPLARGCHNLIRQGATLVETSADIVEHLAGLLAFKRESIPVKTQSNCTGRQTPGKVPLAKQPGQKPEDDHLNREESLLLAALGYDPCPFDQLACRIHLDTGLLTAMLMSLELRGLVNHTPQGYMRT